MQNLNKSAALGSEGQALDAIETLAMFSRAHEYISEATHQLVSAMTELGDDSDGLAFAMALVAVPEDLRATLRGVRVAESAAEALRYLVRAVIARAFFDFASLLDGLDAPGGFEDQWSRVALTRARAGADPLLLHDAFWAAAGSGWKHRKEPEN